ncbi:MAG: cysteine desulfurase family protein [Candidatus Sumerlaeaceae bacterium]
MIYLDNCATTPLEPIATEAMHRVNVEVFGNPSSIHTEGRRAAKVLADARSVLAESIAAKSSEIVFTSSGTESNNLVIASVVQRFFKDAPVHIVTSTTEHASVRNRLAFEKRLHGEGVQVTEIPVDGTGLVDMQQLRGAVRPNTRLITLLHCNNETGVLQDLAGILAVKLAFPTVLLHLDIVQSYLKTPFDVRTMPVDFLTACAHKIHGPKGIGFLYVRDGVDLAPLLVGGGQENFRRAGTENVAGAAGFSAAAQQMPRAETLHPLLLELEGTFFHELDFAGVAYTLNGAVDQTHRMPGIFNISIADVKNKEDLQIAMDLEGVQLSSTSACHSGVVVDSPVLKAMGLSEERRAGAIRIGFSRMLNIANVRRAAQTLAMVTKRMVT